MIEPQASSFDNISPTALMVAYARQFTDIPYSNELAQLVNAQTVLEQLLAKTSEEPVEVAVLIEGRYKAINQVMAQSGATQVIELASGLLPRGMAMSQNPNVTFVESDLPVKQFVSEQGFCVEKYSTLDVMDQLTCLEPLGIDHDVAESLLAASSVFALTVKTENPPKRA